MPVDVAIHCGDLIDGSKLHEFQTSLEQLRRIKSPLKLVIAGNHDFILDTPTYQKKAAYSQQAFSIEPALVAKEYGHFGEARQIITDVQQGDGIVLLEEGTRHFDLQNGARLTVYASPFTPSLDADWGFQFKQGEHHTFNIDQKVDVVITHGPPKGVLDYTANRQRGGCEHLFAAIVKARPRMHCFGHIHEAWGAKMVAWRGETSSENPIHFTEIDNGASVVVDSLASRRRNRNTVERLHYRHTSHCSNDEYP